MRGPLFLAAFALVVVMIAVPSEACARGSAPTGGGYPNCPQYVLAVGEEGLSVSTDSYGRLLLDLHTLGLAPYAGYVVIDAPSLYAPGNYFLAIWQYSETNGVAGLQRFDEMCQSVDEWWQADERLFIC